MASRRAGIVVVSLVTLSALAASGFVLPGQPQPESPVEVSVAASALCPAKTGATTKVTAGATGGSGQWRYVPDERSQGLAREAPSSLDMKDASVISVSSGGLLGGVAETADAKGLERGLAMASCSQPSTAGWFVGLRSTTEITTELILVNAESAQANVDLTFFGPGGRLPVAGSSSISIKGKSEQVVSLQPLIQLNDPLAVQVSVTTGRVATYARERIYRPKEKAADGVDWLPASKPPATDIVVPGVPTDAGLKYLSIVNPNEERVEADVTVLTEQGEEPLPEGQNLALVGLSTLAIKLESPLPPGTVAFRINSKQPILAGVRVSKDEGSDAAFAVAMPRVTQLALLPVALEGRRATLNLTNPGTTSARVTVKAIGGTGKNEETFNLASMRTVSWPVSGGKEPVMIQLEVLQGSVTGAVSVVQDLDGVEGRAVIGISGGFEPTRQVDPLREPGMHVRRKSAR